MAVLTTLEASNLIYSGGQVGCVAVISHGNNRLYLLPKTGSNILLTVFLNNSSGTLIIPILWIRKLRL